MPLQRAQPSSSRPAKRPGEGIPATSPTPTASRGRSPGIRHGPSRPTAVWSTVEACRTRAAPLTSPPLPDFCRKLPSPGAPWKEWSVARKWRKVAFPAGVFGVSAPLPGHDFVRISSCEVVEQIKLFTFNNLPKNLLSISCHFLPFSAKKRQQPPKSASQSGPPSDPINLTALVDWLFPDTAPLSG